MQGAASIGILGTANIFGRCEVGGGSYATIDAYAVLSGGSLLALNGSVIQAAGLIGDGSGNVIAVDSSSVIRIGAAPASAPGTLTLATEAPEEFAGLICANVVDNAALSVSAGGTLLIDMTAMAKFDPYQNSPTISGGGLLLLAENSTLGLGVADSVAIDFNGSGGTLLLAAMPTAAICGFASGDQIDVEQTVTGLTYTQVNATFATVTLTNGAAAVGVLAFNGMNIGSSFAFHLDAAANGANAVITLQTLAITASPVALLYGTVGSDTLTATASGQTIGGLGGNDILNGGGFHSDNFRDLTANLNGSQIENFQTTDAIDFTDLNPGSASLTYTGGILSITDGTHSASISVSFATTPASGSFHIGFDGTAGTLLLWS
jgi:hypothetical protein